MHSFKFENGVSTNPRMTAGPVLIHKSKQAKVTSKKFHVKTEFLGNAAPERLSGIQT